MIEFTMGLFRAVVFLRRFWNVYGIGGILLCVSVGLFLGVVLPSCVAR